ncbi:MAG: hypothetical protein ACFFAO_00170 [Candidatus Hermodarchaeota archaeon]
MEFPKSFGYLSVRLEAVLAQISYLELAPKIRIFSNVEGILSIRKRILYPLRMC